MRHVGLGSLLLLAALTVACHGDDVVAPSTTTSSTTSITVASTTTTPMTFVTTTTTTVPPFDTLVITNVVDGDTLDVLQSDGTEQRVRLIGIDTPEVYGGVECYGPEASERAKALIAAAGSRGRLELDDSQGRLDRYGRLLAYVWLGDVMLNEMLISEGYAEEYLYRTTYRYRGGFMLAEMRAQAMGLGLWGAC